MRRGRSWVSGFALLVLGALAVGLMGGAGASGQVPPCDGYGYGYGYGYNGYGYGEPCPTPSPSPTPTDTPTQTPVPTVSPSPTATVTATPTPPPVDRRPCRVRVTSPPRQSLRTVRRFGLKLRVSTNETCLVRARVFVDRRTARRLGIKRRPRGKVLVGSKTQLVRTGSRTIVIKLSRRVRRALRGERRISFLVRITTLDRAGNRGSLNRRIVVRR